MNPRVRSLVLLLAALAAAAGCEREQRRFDTPPSPASGAGTSQMSSLHVGPAASAASAAAESASSVSPTSVAVGTVALTPAGKNPHEQNAFAVSQGKRLFRWYNCSGCHANGGGNMGPPLMDDKWIYGAEPEQIVATILQGRPNGMPSFAGRIPEEQAWQIAAYVRSMSGQLRTDVAANRGDSLSSGPPESRRDKLEPRPVNDSPKQ
jgi:cytochrome c oxidase cbb3-type subunit 3